MKALKCHWPYIVFENTNMYIWSVASSWVDVFDWNRLIVYYELVTGWQQIFESMMVEFEHFNFHHAKFVQLTFDHRAKRVLFCEMLSEQNTYSRVFQINPLEYTTFEQWTFLLYIDNSKIDFIESSDQCWYDGHEKDCPPLLLQNISLFLSESYIEYSPLLPAKKRCCVVKKWAYTLESMSASGRSFTR